MKIDLRPHRSTVPAGADEEQRVFAIVEITPPARSHERRTPAACVVVDTSGSMYAKTAGGSSKIDVASDVLRDLPRTPGFGEGAQLAIVRFDTEASVLLPLSILPEDAIDVVGSHANRLRRYSGGTRLARGLSAGLAELERASADAVRRLIVITDGETVDERECRRLIADAARDGVVLFGVGLGEDYNEDFLTELAAKTNGRVAHVDDGDASRMALRDALREELLRAQKETTRDVVVRLETPRATRLMRALRVHPEQLPLEYESDARTTEWRLGDLASGQSTVLLLDFALPPEDVGRHHVCSVTVRYGGAGRGAGVHEERRDLQVEFVEGPPRPDEIDDEVMNYARQAKVTSLLDEMTRRSRLGDREGTSRSLVEARRLVRRLSSDDLDEMLDRAERELGEVGNLTEATRKSLKIGARMRTAYTMSGPPMLRTPASGD